MTAEQLQRIETYGLKYVANLSGSPATWPLKAYMAGAKRGYDKAREDMGQELPPPHQGHGREQATEIVGPVRYSRGQLFDANGRKIANVCEGFYGLGDVIASSISLVPLLSQKFLQTAIREAVDKYVESKREARADNYCERCGRPYDGAKYSKCPYC